MKQHLFYFQLFLKRIVDITGASVGLLFLVPLFLFVMLLIKLDSRGPVFFMHERIGKDGKPFKPFKFRTMESGAITRGLKYTVAQHDARITRVGKFLRNWSIDELPQLINILKGEMSLVGPRPTFRYQVEQYDDEQKKRLFVKPGMVGLALVKGRNALSWEERIWYDVWYVEHWSLLLDIRIFLQSFWVVLVARKGLYGEGGVNDPFDNK